MPSSSERIRLVCGPLNTPDSILASITEADRAANGYTVEDFVDGDLSGPLQVTDVDLVPGRSVAEVKAAYARAALELRKAMGLQATAGLMRVVFSSMFGSEERYREAKAASRRALREELAPLVASRRTRREDETDSGEMAA